MRVLVTDGDNRAALAVTRSLGRAGHDVIVAEKRAPSLAHASRYCRRREVYPDPVIDAAAFVEALVNLARDAHVDCVVPIADITTFLVTANRHRFAPGCAVPFGDAHIVERAADKVDVLQTAERVGVPVPRSVVVRSPHEIPAHDIPYPLVIKPWRSRILTASGWQSTSVSYASSPADLQRDLAGRGAFEFPVMLQERIDGPGVGVFACYHQGTPLAFFSHRRLRERPPWGGVSVLCESVALPEATRRDAGALLEAIGWQGVAMVEFKVDTRDGLPKLMEINGRFWGSLQLAIDAGVDFPQMLLATAIGGPLTPPPSYTVGVRERWAWGDVDSLLQTLRGKGPSSFHPARARALWDFAKVWGRQLHYDNPKADDPWPFVFETGNRLRDILDYVRPRRRTVAPAIGRLRSAADPAASLAASQADDVAAPDNAVNADDARGLMDRPASPQSTVPTSAPVAVVSAVPGAPTGDLRVSLVRSLAETGLDADGWNALVARSQTNSIFQTYQWTTSWLQAFGEQFEPHLFVASRDGRPVAIAPMVLNRAAVYPERALRFIGSGRADYCDFIASGAESEALTAVVDALLDHPGWDVVHLGNIPAVSPTTEALRIACEARHIGVKVHYQYPCPVLVIDGHEAEARRILDKPSLRRCQRTFERAGPCHERDLMRAAEIEPHLQAFFLQHIGRWHGTDSPSLFLEERNRYFYRLLTQALDGTGWLMFSIIESNGRPAAFHFGFDYNGSLIWYKPAFDASLADLSPGNIMVRHLIEQALRRQRRELDFTVGDEAFKKRFTNQVRHTMRVEIYRSTLAHLAWQTREALDVVSESVGLKRALSSA